MQRASVARTNEGLQDNLMRNRRFIREGWNKSKISLKARELEEFCQILIELDLYSQMNFVIRPLCLVNDRCLFYSGADLPLHRLL